MNQLLHRLEQLREVSGQLYSAVAGRSQLFCSLEERMARLLQTYAELHSEETAHGAVIEFLVIAAADPFAQLCAPISDYLYSHSIELSQLAQPGPVRQASLQCRCKVMQRSWRDPTSWSISG